MMKFPLVIVFLVLVPGNILGQHANFRDDLTYDDLVQTNVTCAYSETCKNEDPSQERTCGCDIDCSLFGTCCIDSPHREKSAPMVECRKAGPSGSYFLVSRCPPTVGEDSAWKDLCEKEWDGEDDMMKLAPVTSLDTFAAYKNYYCFRCHEDVERFVSWDLRMPSNSVDGNGVSKDFSVTYDRERQRWIATTGDGYVLEDVEFDFLAPGELPVLPEVCNFVLVSGCDDYWTDEDTREKCGAYTAVVYSKNNGSVSFKNPHCALCNYVPVENIDCQRRVSAAAKGRRSSRSSHYHIIRGGYNIAKKCEENWKWDPYFKKCRRLVCAIPGTVLKEGRCVRA